MTRTAPTLPKGLADYQVPDVVRKAAPEILKVDAESRSMRFVASRETEDRTGDIIRLDGWRLDNFRRNPVALWAHQTRRLPIGDVTEIGPDGDKLLATIQFHAEDLLLDDELRGVVRMVLAGALRAVSVGAAPLEYAYRIVNEQFVGIDYIEQELVELSVVTVPAHQDALAVGRSLGLTDETLSKIFAPAAPERLDASVELELRRAELDILKLGASG